MQPFNEKILAGIGKQLIKKQQTIALAESVSSGLLQYAMGSITDASQFFQGGITVYNLAQKFARLKVEPIHALKVNCVSQKVAEEMALNVCTLFGSHWGVAVTGYASPVPESGNKTFAFYAIAYNGAIKASRRIASRKKLPAEVQFAYADTILKHLNDLL